MINIVNKGINIFSKLVFLRGGGYNVAMGSQQKLCLRAKSAPPPLTHMLSYAPDSCSPISGTKLSQQ